ncbi:MAG: hypothetical protein MZV70_31650 [Desulfobacterales bacterium]|nr:hypothetical protein [Desulfobacterales bacterium]
MRQPRKAFPPTPSEQGELFSVPVLQYRQADLWEQFDDTHLLQGIVAASGLSGGTAQFHKKLSAN